MVNEKMNDLKLLYEKLSEIDYKDMYEMETEFFLKLYYDFSENRLPWITAFLTVSSWFGSSQRSGVWTFYEVGNIQEIKRTIQYLRENGDYELADVLEKGVHDYQDPKYGENYDYPEEWLKEADKIDEWISEHEDWLWKWEYDILVMNRESILKGEVK